MHTYTRTNGTPVTSYSVTETAQLVRAALKQAFPGVKFSVRSRKYAGGASIDVSWTDGPTTRGVAKVTDLYEGATFDGMIDLKSYKDSVLVDENGVPQVVQFGADYIFEQREVSAGFQAKCVARFEEIYRQTYDADKLYDEIQVMPSGAVVGGRYQWQESGSTLLHRLALTLSEKDVT
jgi:hypothetical protein